ncbi:hypothetical protein B0H34DRAFT_678670 [Crassisporium funariophilum]|nr:hypothetical protein B0H34DRAFT_678670 [Crassisporium funariophilum]
MTDATFTAFPSGPFTFRAFAPGTHVILTQTWFAPNTKAGPFDIFGNYLWGTDSSDKMEAPSASDPPSASFYRQIAPLPKRVGATLLHDSSIASISSEITTMDPHSPTHHHPISIDDPMSPTHDGELKAPINDPLPSAFSTAPHVQKRSASPSLDEPLPKKAKKFQEEDDCDGDHKADQGRAEEGSQVQAQEAKKAVSGKFVLSKGKRIRLEDHYTTRLVVSRTRWICAIAGCTQICHGKGDIERHLQSNNAGHFPLDHPCLECKKTFSRSDSLKRHRKAAHK